MYVPTAFAEERIDVLHDLIAAHDFATLITRGGGGGEGGGGEMVASHLPTLLLPTRGERGTIQVHLARQNEQWRALAAGEPVLAIFQGPHGYVSPRWYRNPVNVPTWNYAVVHARGTSQIMEESVLRQYLHALVARYEPRESGWDAGALPAEVMDKLAGQIVGFDIEIQSIQGKWKLGQNRTHEDREGAIAGLRQSDDAAAHVLADWMAAAMRG